MIPPASLRDLVARIANIALVLALFLAGCRQVQSQEPKEVEYHLFRSEQRVIIQGYSGDAMEPFLARDGRFLLFNNRNEAPENTNLHYAARQDDLHFDYKGEIQGVNTAALEGVPSLDKDGILYFVSSRDYDQTLSTLYRGRFVNGVVSQVELVPGVSRHERGIVNFDAEISADGKTLFLVDGDFTGNPKPKAAVIVMAVKQDGGFRRDPQSDIILHNVNAGRLAYAPCISSDGLELFFTRVAKLNAAAQPALFRAARKRLDEPFGVPERIAGIAGFVEGPTLSSDGRRLYYHKRENGHFVLYMMTRKTR